MGSISLLTYVLKVGWGYGFNPKAICHANAVGNT